MDTEQPQTTPAPHPNQVLGRFSLRLGAASLRIRLPRSQEYIDDLDRLLKAATHPRSTALLKKALEEAKKEGLANGATKDGPGIKPRTTARSTASTTKISTYGKMTAEAPLAPPAPLSVLPPLPVLCVCMCVYTSLFVCVRALTPPSLFCVCVCVLCVCVCVCLCVCVCAG